MANTYGRIFGWEEFRLRPVVGDIELAMIHAQDGVTYGEEMLLSMANKKDWLQRYPSDMWGLWKRELLIGNFSCWPMAQEQILAMAKGDTATHQAQPLTAAEVTTAGGHDWWYIGNMLLTPPFQNHRQKPIAFTSAQLFNHLADFNVRFPINIYTSAYVKSSENLMRHLGFQPMLNIPTNRVVGSSYLLIALDKNSLFAPMMKHGLDSWLQQLPESS